MTLNFKNVERGPRMAVSIQEAAGMISIGANTLRRHIKRGRIRASKVGRRVLIQVKELERFLNEGAKL